MDYKQLYLKEKMKNADLVGRMKMCQRLVQIASDQLSLAKKQRDDHALTIKILKKKIKKLSNECKTLIGCPMNDGETLLRSSFYHAPPLG